MADPARAGATGARGRFIAIEGIEGSGKSTLVASLAAALAARGDTVVATREPGGTPLGERVRATFKEPGLAIDPLAEAFLICASRAQHVRDVIAPALGSGAWVLCDRFVLATLAYQGYGRGLPLDVLRAVCDAATSGLVPDVTLLVDVPLDVSSGRVRARAATDAEPIDRIEREGDAFHARVRNGYLSLATADPERIAVVDGTLEPTAVLARALALLR